MFDNKYLEYNIITRGYSCCVPGCKSNYKKDEPSVTVFTFPSIGELRQTLLQNIPRKFDKITKPRRVCIKYFEDKDVHGFNIHTHPMELLNNNNNNCLKSNIQCT